MIMFYPIEVHRVEGYLVFTINETPPQINEIIKISAIEHELSGIYKVKKIEEKPQNRWNLTVKECVCDLDMENYA
jgi:hypothetical protein